MDGQSTINDRTYHNRCILPCAPNPPGMAGDSPLGSLAARDSEADDTACARISGKDPEGGAVATIPKRPIGDNGGAVC